MAREHWLIDPVDYPLEGSPREKLEFLLRYAVLAPSSHNAQPWLFRIGEAHVDVLADRTRALPVVDPFDRELTIGCAAAAEMLAVGMRAHGHLGELKALPSPEEPDLIVRVGIGPASPPSERDRAMRDAIVSRVTDRRAFSGEAVPAAAQEEMAAAAAMHGVAFAAVAERDGKHAIAELVAEGDRRQFADPSFRRELAQWLHPRMTGDGLALGSNEILDIFTPVAALVVRSFDIGAGQAARDLELAEHSPLLVVLATSGDDPTAWIAAGRALAAVSLTATLHGLSGSYLSQPIEIADLRGKLAAAAGASGTPQLLMRFGAPRPDIAPMPHAARRPLPSLFA